MADAPLSTRLAAISSRHAARDVVVQIIGRVLNLALGVAATIAIARMLGDSGFGRWTTVLVVVQLCGFLTDFGIETVAVRRAAADPDREAHWIGAAVSLRLALSVPVALCAAFAVAAIAEGSQMLTAGLILAAGLLVGAPTALRAVFQLRVRNDISIAIMTANSVLWTSAVLAIGAAGLDMVALAVAFVAIGTLTMALQVGLALARVRVRLRGSRSLWRELGRLGIPLGIAGVLTLGYGRIDQVLVFELAGDRDAGLYGAVYRIFEQAQFLPIALMTTLFPILAAAHPVNPARVRMAYDVSTKVLAAASLPALAFTLTASEPLMRVLFGDEFAAAAPALPVLMASYVVIGFGYLAGNMIIVLDRQRRLILYAAIGLVFNVALNVALVPRYGFLAAAWTTLATEILVVGLQTGLVWRESGLLPALAPLVPVAAAAAAMAALTWLLMSAGLAFGWLVGVACLTYVALLLAFGALDVREVAALLRGAPAPAQEGR